MQDTRGRHWRQTQPPMLTALTTTMMMMMIVDETAITCCSGRSTECLCSCLLARSLASMSSVCFPSVASLLQSHFNYDLSLSPSLALSPPTSLCFIECTIFRSRHLLESLSSWPISLSLSLSPDECQLKRAEVHRRRDIGLLGTTATCPAAAVVVVVSSFNFSFS